MVAVAESEVEFSAIRAQGAGWFLASHDGLHLPIARQTQMGSFGRKHLTITDQFKL